MNGRESSTVYTSDENLLIILPVAVVSKNAIGAYNNSFGYDNSVKWKHKR